MNLENNIVIFKTDDNQIAVDVRFYDESVWLTLDQMAALFERDKSAISRHIKTFLQKVNLLEIQLLQILQQLRQMEKNIRLITIIWMLSFLSVTE